MTDSDRPFVSVIIPVFNDAGRLGRCLDALERQTYPQNRYEVIVIDNGSSDEVEKVTERFGRAALDREERPGSYAARNKGLSLARGATLAFTDSDCIPASDWIEQGVKALEENPGCGLAAGRVKLFYRNRERPSSVELYEKLHAFHAEKRVEQYHYGVTANLFVPRSTFEDVGFFNDSLKSGGDVEWGNRVHSHGLKLIYAPEACVDHPARYSLGELYRKTIRVEGGVHEFQRSGGYSLGEAARDSWRLIRSVLGLVKRFVFGRPPADELAGSGQKVKYLAAFTFVGLVQIFERLRLRLGGEARR